jgi:hypothetical protein
MTKYVLAHCIGRSSATSPDHKNVMMLLPRMKTATYDQKPDMRKCRACFELTSGCIVIFFASEFDCTALLPVLSDAS